MGLDATFQRRPARVKPRRRRVPPSSRAWRPAACGAGTIKACAIATAERSPSDPNVPTFAELGYPEVDMPGWGALFAPVKTPQAILEKMTAEMNRIVLLPDVKARLAELGFDSVGWTPPRINEFFKEQLVRTRRLVDSGRVKL